MEEEKERESERKEFIQLNKLGRCGELKYLIKNVIFYRLVHIHRL